MTKNQKDITQENISLPQCIAKKGKTTKTLKCVITVAEGTQAVTLSISPVDTLLAGNTNDFTFEATDKTGMMYFEEDYSTGNAKLKYKADDANYDTPVYIQIQLTNPKTSQGNFTIKANATPKVITKINKDFNVISTNKGEREFVVETGNLKMESQYGSEISFENMRVSGYRVDITTADPNNEYISLEDWNGTTVESGVRGEFSFVKDTTKDNEKVFSVKTNKLPTDEMVEKTYNFGLYDDTKKETLSGSDYELIISIYPQGKLTGYSVEEIKPTYVTSKSANDSTTGGDFARELKVTAKRSGTTVVLEKKQYNIILHGDLKADESTGKIFSSKDTEFKDGVTEIKTTVDVVINATGETFTKDVLLTNVAPKVTSVKADSKI